MMQLPGYGAQGAPAQPLGVPTTANPGGVQSPTDPLQYGLQTTIQALRALGREAQMQGDTELSLDAEQFALKLRKHAAKREKEQQEMADLLKGAGIASQL